MRFNGHMSALELLPDATRSLTRTVDGLTDEAFAEPSLLPGWTRAHVIAHLVLNGEALAGVLTGLAAGEEVAMYPSSEARDNDVEELATAEPSELRERLLAATTGFADACARMPEQGWTGIVRRTPDSDATYPAAEVPSRRLGEVEIHHVDLGAGYDRTMWSREFATDLLTTHSRRLERHGPVTLRASDVGRSWAVGGEGGPWIAGTVVDLAWWITGRGDGGGLTAETGTLPEVGSW